MGRTLVFVAIAFLAGLGAGFYARKTGVGSGTPQQTDTRAANLAAIRKFEKAEMEATLTQDPSALNTLWSEDAVKLDVPGAPVVGIKALGEMYAKFRVDYPEFKVLKYAPDIKDVEIADGWAIEVGDFAGSFKMSAKDEPISINDKGMRLLKRQSDGSWKLALVGMR